MRVENGERNDKGETLLKVIWEIPIESDISQRKTSTTEQKVKVIRPSDEAEGRMSQT